MSTAVKLKDRHDTPPHPEQQYLDLMRRVWTGGDERRDRTDFAARWGDLGPVYGVQWTHWPKYVPAGDGLFRRDPDGVNQIAKLIEGLKTDPASRRHIFTGWNVAELDQTALPPWTFFALCRTATIEMGANDNGVFGLTCCA